MCYGETGNASVFVLLFWFRLNATAHLWLFMSKNRPIPLFFSKKDIPFAFFDKVFTVKAVE